MFCLLAAEQGNVFNVLNSEHISLFPEHSVLSLLFHMRAVERISQ